MQYQYIKSCRARLALFDHPSKASLTPQCTCIYLLDMIKYCLKPLLYLIIHARTSWLQRKKPTSFQDFVTEYQGLRDPEMKTGMHIIFCVHTVWL